MSGRKVVTEKSSIQCGPAPGHQGTVAAKGQAVLTAGGAGVLLAADLTAATIAGCKNTSVSSTNVPCSKVQSVSASAVSTCLTVGGKGVVLDGPLAGVTVGTPPGTLPVVDVKQSVLTAE
jgi:hypothetical protein